VFDLDLIKSRFRMYRLPVEDDGDGTERCLEILLPGGKSAKVTANSLEWERGNDEWDPWVHDAFTKPKATFDDVIANLGDGWTVVPQDDGSIVFGAGKTTVIDPINYDDFAVKVVVSNESWTTLDRSMPFERAVSSDDIHNLHVKLWTSLLAHFPKAPASMPGVPDPKMKTWADLFLG